MRGLIAAPFDRRPAGLRLPFLHLDTSLTHVADRHVLCVPWFLEHAHAGKDLLSEYIRGARTETVISDDDASAALDFLKELGKITLFLSCQPIWPTPCRW